MESELFIPLYRSIMKKIVTEQKPAMGLHEQEIVAFAQKVMDPCS